MSPEEDPFLIKDKECWAAEPGIGAEERRRGQLHHDRSGDAPVPDAETWQPDEIVYVTDGRQQLHFRQLFAIFRRWKPEVAAKMRLAHVWFGSILGRRRQAASKRAPARTIRLTDLLDEAEERALKIVVGEEPGPPGSRAREIARMIGIGAMKYADLLPNRQSDYVFSWDKMLELAGNTAPYLQYSYVRILSIFRKREAEGITASESAVLPV